MSYLSLTPNLTQAEAKLVFGASSRKEAISHFRAWHTRWFDEAESAVRCLEKDLFHERYPGYPVRKHGEERVPLAVRVFAVCFGL